MIQVNPSVLLTCYTSSGFCAVPFQVAWLDRYQFTLASFEALICSLDAQLHPGPQLDLQGLGKDCRNGGTLLSSHTAELRATLWHWQMWIWSIWTAWEMKALGGNLHVQLGWSMLRTRTGILNADFIKWHMHSDLLSYFFQPLLPTIGNFYLRPPGLLYLHRMYSPTEGRKKHERNLHIFVASCRQKRCHHSDISVLRCAAGCLWYMTSKQTLFPWQAVLSCNIITFLLYKSV